MKFFPGSTQEMTHAVRGHLAQYEHVAGEFASPLPFAANPLEGFGLSMPARILLMGGAGFRAFTGADNHCKRQSEFRSVMSGGCVMNPALWSNAYVRAG